MRKSLTPPEARLWSALKLLRAEGYKFRRQVPYRGYFLDFACLSRKLCVEVDGGFHFTPDRLRHDQVRDAVLAGDGFLTLRLAPVDIRDNLDGIMIRIRETLAHR